MSFLGDDGGFVGRIIASPQRSYRLLVAADGASGRLESLRQSSLPPELPARNLPKVPPSPVKANCRPTTGGEVALLMVHTPAARRFFDVPTDVYRWLVLALDEANRSYENSGSAMRVRLVGVKEVQYVESGSMETDYDRLKDKDDKDLHVIHEWRQEASIAADLVVLTTLDPRAAGAAEQFANYHLGDTSFAPKGFAIVSIGALTATYAVPHELGHLMGSLHDAAASKGTFGAYDWSHGHLQRHATAPCMPSRDLMAFGPDLTPRLEWSRPGIDSCGDPTGSAELEDNARTLSDTASTLGLLHCALEE